MTVIEVNSVMFNVVQRGAGPVLLLVHGFPLDHQMWQGQIDTLAEDFTVIAPDLRGFGRSDVPAETIPLAQYADDLASLLDELKVAGAVTLVGLSMGGYIALQFWHRHATRLERLILCDTRAKADSPEVARNRLELARRVVKEGPGLLADTMLDKLFSEHTRHQRSELVAATRQVMMSTSPTGIAVALRAMAERPDATPWLSEITQPTLLICGSEDVITPAQEMATIAAAMPHARLVTIAQSAHMAPLENSPAVNQAIRDFVITTSDSSLAR